MLDMSRNLTGCVPDPTRERFEDRADGGDSKPPNKRNKAWPVLKPVATGGSVKWQGSTKAERRGAVPGGYHSCH